MSTQSLSFQNLFFFFFLPVNVIRHRKLLEKAKETHFTFSQQEQNILHWRLVAILRFMLFLLVLKAMITTEHL